MFSYRLFTCTKSDGGSYAEKNLDIFLNHLFSSIEYLRYLREVRLYNFNISLSYTSHNAVILITPYQQQSGEIFPIQPDK